MMPTHTMMLGLSCAREDHHFVIASADVEQVVRVQCSPPPPWTQPWIGGLTWVDANLVVVIDPMSLLALEAAVTPQFITVVVMKAQPYQPRWAIIVDAIADKEDEKAFLGISGTSDNRRMYKTPMPDACFPIDWHCPTDWFKTALDDVGISVPVLDVAAVSKAVSTRYRTNFAA